MGIRCFLIEPSVHIQRRLRVDTWRPCPKGRYKGAHCGALNTYADIVTAPYVPDAQGVDRPSAEAKAADNVLLDDTHRALWPDHCEGCGQPIDFDAEHVYRYVDRERMWRNVETGEEYARIGEAPVGAMWRAPWLTDYCASQDDGAPLCVKTPGGDWVIDSQASNCGQPDDRHQDHHHCWVRHGEAPNITVDKQGAPTCTAGAGSIMQGTYHGFLRSGELT